MKYLFLLFLTLFLFQSCSDNESVTKNNGCKSDSDCKIWQSCNSDKICELKDGMCAEDKDCTDETKNTCSIEHLCVEAVTVEDCTLDGNECANNTNGKTVCVDDKCTDAITVEECTESGNECVNNTNGKTVCIDNKCDLPPEVTDCTEDTDCANNTNGKTICLNDKCASPVEVTDCTEDANCANNTNDKTICLNDKCASPVEVTDCTVDGNECSDNTNGATVCVDGHCAVDGCTPSEEICDGIDNDCDGFIDEDLVAENSDKQFGVCAGSKKVCALDPSDNTVKWLEPDYTKISTYEETETSCDELDNDCDNAVDEGCGGCTDGDKKDCGLDIGACEKGQQTCTNGVWGDCIGGISPVEEICDGRDNDCDGDIDEDLVAENADKQDGVCAGSKKVCALDSSDNTVKWLEPDYTEISTYEETETSCDNLDNDCDGVTDENLTKVYYKDEDGDTFGKPSDHIEACVAPEGYVERNSDCNDSDADVNPGAVELCDGIDNNCDGHTDEGFANTDGDNLPDCMDTDDDDDGDPDTSDCAPLDASIHHGATEACDTVDNNCDGSVDEGCPCVDGQTQECGTSNIGECKKGTQTCDSTGTWGDCVGVVEPTDEICDGKDNNCDGSIDENFTDTDNDKKADCVDPDDDNDGITDANDNCQFIPNADQANNDGDDMGDACDNDDDNDGDLDTTDCAPLDASINHGATETCDTVDNNCDGVTDEGCDCVDGTTQACGSDIGECVKGVQTCSNGAWGDCAGEVKPTNEICDGKDNDCDGLTDTDDDSLEATPLSTNQNGICAGSKKVCAGENGWVDPVFSDLPNYEADDASCDGIDNNCNGTNDEGYDDTATVTSCGVGECSANGHLVCTNGEAVSDCVAGDPVDEVCDGKDNNCNGEVDDGGLLDLAPDADKQDGVCSGSKKVCDGVNGWVEPNYSDYSDKYEASETSCDDLDNDCDASVDENPIELCTSSSIDNPTIKACIYNASNRASSCKQILTNVSYLSLGYQHSCAFNPDSGSNGEAYCWGDNEYGELGNGNNTSYFAPRKVDSSLDASVVMDTDSGASFNCSLIADGTVKCWGRNNSGQLGDNSNDDSNVAVTVQEGLGLGTSDLGNIQNISTGVAHACAVFDDNTDNYVYCWGANSKGQLGDNSTTNRNKAVKVKKGTGFNDTLEGAVKVVAGLSHTCALMNNDKVYCWGDNSKGQLGDNRAEDHSEIAIEVPNLDNVLDIVAGSNFTCVNYLNNGGNYDIKCWGDNSSKQILNTNFSLYDEPQSVNLNNVNDFVANGNDICYILSNNTVECRGDNSKQQLNAGPANQPSPITLTDTKGYRIIGGEMGAQHLCVIVINSNDQKAVMCRALNDRGQLGLGYNSSNPDYLEKFEFVLAGEQPGSGN